MRDVIQFIVYTHLFEEDKIPKNGTSSHETNEGRKWKKASIRLLLRATCFSVAQQLAYN